jgi:uncharacterized protein YjbI with pentapeptide repeats
MVGVDLPNADLSRANLQGVCLQSATLKGCTLHQSILKSSDLSLANLSEADLSEASLCQASLAAARLTRARINKTSFKMADLQETNLREAFGFETDFSEANVSAAVLRGVKLPDANFTKANLKESLLADAELNGADFSFADLENAWFTKSSLRFANFTRTNLASAKLTHTDLTCCTIIDAVMDGIEYSSEHEAMTDGSDHIITSRRNRVLNWSKLRRLGQFPLFSVSWGALALSVLAINLIGASNNILVVDEWINYQIPISLRMSLILLDSILLVTGTTIFKLGCPVRVQEFSESQWVEEHRQPRLLYLREKWSGHVLQWLTLVFIAAGALVGLGLIGEQLRKALVYVATSL